MNNNCVKKDNKALLPNKEYNIIFSPNVERSLRSLINKLGFLTCEISRKQFSPSGENFLGILCAVIIKGVTVEGDDKDEDIIMKVITPGEQTTFLSLPDVYARELFMYEELSNVFDGLQTQFNVPAHERYKTVKSYRESTSEVIFLENMSKKGFLTYFRMDIVSLEFAELAVEELAKLHGLSFVLKFKRPTYFERRVKKLKHPFNFNDDWQSFVANMSGNTLKYFNGDTKKKMEDFMATFMEKYAMYLEDEESKLCLCHGDYRPNNIMMKKINGQISEVIPIDYQLIYYGCPVLDFIYFIFSATDQAFRKTHIPHLKDIYHNTMNSFLQFFDINIDIVFPRKLFESLYASRLDYGLLISLLLIPILMASENEVPDLTTESIANVKLNTDDSCKDRMMGIVNDFLEWGYL